MPGVGKDVLDLGAFRGAWHALRGLLTPPQFRRQRLAGMDGDAVGRCCRQTAARSGQTAQVSFGRRTVLPSSNGMLPRPAGQLPGGEIKGELVLGIAAAGVADPPDLADYRQSGPPVTNQDQGQAGRPMCSLDR